MRENFYTVNDKNREEFYKIPKDLFVLKKYANLSNEARMLYGILKDRLDLSIRNNWIDDNGYVYFNYSRQAIADLLMVSLNTAKSRFKELKNVGLLVEKTSEKGQSLRLYLCKISVENEVVNNGNIEKEDIEKIPVGGSKFDEGQNLTGSKFGLGGGQNLAPNKTNIIRLNIYSHFNSKNIIVHRQLNSKISNAINKALKDYTHEEIISAIDHYSEIFHSDFYYEHKWSLDKFLKQDNGISRFTDEGDIWNSYLSKKGINNQDEIINKKDNDENSKKPIMTFEEDM
ncbi:replication initiator protein A [Clostridium tertium]|uniref:replication initiator protein A n=1 Tax=Clostridium tertium TaxID=1559 RepID=UPI00232CC33D|nr:replication initiator protein A [Clostridium tertium]MDB1943721.1 replication initiator protein A [Clostridium tertium]MDB1951113.1 replication initiator protein A [Clostridium tertium]